MYVRIGRSKGTVDLIRRQQASVMADLRLICSQAMFQPAAYHVSSVELCGNLRLAAMLFPVVLLKERQHFHKCWDFTLSYCHIVSIKYLSDHAESRWFAANLFHTLHFVSLLGNLELKFYLPSGNQKSVTDPKAAYLSADQRQPGLLTALVLSLALFSLGLTRKCQGTARVGEATPMKDSYSISK